MLPLPGSSTFDPDEELVEPCLKRQRMEGASPSEFHTTSSTSESPQIQEELKKWKQKTKIVETEKLRDTSPLTVIPTTGHGKELMGKAQGGKGMLPLLGSSTSDSEESEVESFTSDSEEELEEMRMKLHIRKALENAMYPTIRSGLAKFDVSLPVELQNYVSYLLNEPAKLHFRKQVLQPPRALEELREAMDVDELIAFLTIHIREGAWQVVLLFTDELPRVKLPRDWCGIMDNEDEDEEVSNEVIYSSKSGILNGWLTEDDPDLITLCKAITNKDWKVTRLILSRSRISDECLKNLSTALPQSELYSLTLHGNDLQSQGSKYLCEALISSDCHLTTLNVSLNWWRVEEMVYLCNALTSTDCTLTSLNVSNNTLGDEGIMHLCNALTNVNCTLTSLNVSDNMLRDEGIMHLCNALTSVNCRLTSLNASHIRWGDNGIKHLCNALTRSNCVLTKLKIGFIRLGDGGIKELSGALTNGFCTLTSLDLRGNEFGDEGIKHLCKALTDTNCKLRSLDYHGNRNVTDEGEKYLSQMLTGTDWEVREAQLSRSTTK